MENAVGEAVLSVKSKDSFVGIMGAFIVLVSLGGAFMFGDYTPEEVEPKLQFDTILVNETRELKGTVNEGDSATNEVPIDKENVVKIKFVLTFEDEPDADQRHSNQPDTLKLTVSHPDVGEDSDEASGLSGMITLEFSTTEEDPWDLKDSPWNVTVEAVACGDQEPLIPSIFGFRVINDGSNDWELTVEYDYYSKVGKVQ
jgi:hypothetical protein